MTVEFKKVVAAQREYALYVPDRRAQYDVYIDGVLIGRAKARHLHAASWSWAVWDLEGKRQLFSDGTLARLRRAVERKQGA